MKTIGVVSQKGGVGKSTLARALAVHYASGRSRVLLADMDTNQSTAHEWFIRRTEGHLKTKPQVHVLQFGSVAHALKQANNHEFPYQHLVFDGAPQSSKTTADIAKHSELILIPTGLSTDDLVPSVVLANSLYESGTAANKITFVLSRTGDSKAELAECREYLNSTPYQLIDGHIPEKTAFRRTQDEGLSIVECRYKSPKQQAQSVIKAIASKINELMN